MKREDKYNGWKNYETWNVALWIDNDEGIYNAVRGMLRGCRRGQITAAFAQSLCRSIFDDRTPDGADLCKVHWPEIARCVLREMIG